MQIISDWSGQYSSKAFEKEFNLPFAGPGMYLSKTDTLLVVPCGPVVRRTIWNMKQSKTREYEVYVYNCEWEDTIFPVIAIAPTRHDSR